MEAPLSRGQENREAHPAPVAASKILRRAALVRAAAAHPESHPPENLRRAEALPAVQDGVVNRAEEPTRQGWQLNIALGRKARLLFGCLSAMVGNQPKVSENSLLREFQK